MEDSYPSKLQVWRGWTTAMLPERVAVTGGMTASRPAPLDDVADRYYALEALKPLTAAFSRPSSEPFTLQWFLDIERQRHGRHGRWIPRLLEFGKHAGERLLGVGAGLGTDWVQYARHGASVVVCSPVPEHLALVRRNFELRGLAGQFHSARPAGLPVETASIDVVCLGSLLDGADDPAAVVDEVYRVLKPGGKVLAMAAARFDMDYWSRLGCPWRRWLGLDRRGGGFDASVPRYASWSLRRLFGSFVEARVYKRHLRRAEVPHLWRWVPPVLLERLFGRVLVLKAFKPLSAAMSGQLAA